MNLLDKRYIILNVTEIDKVDFDLIVEDSISTLRLSIDKTKTFINWYGETTPEFINSINSKSKIYTYSEILDVLQGPEWNIDYNQEILP
jgi:hypothetical protein